MRPPSDEKWGVRILVYYIAKRITEAIPTFLGVVLVVFILSTLIAGDPARLLFGQRGDPQTIARIRQEMGLDLPLHQQFLNFVRGAVTLDLGHSYRNNMSVVQAIVHRLPATATLAFAAMFVGVVIGIPIGVVSAIRQNTVLDYASMLGAVIGVTLPTFYLGLLLILVFAVYLRWIPGTGYVAGQWVYLVLPALTLGTRPAALIARQTRASMLEVIRQDYIRTAWAKGLGERAVVIRHGLRNALIPVVTVIGLMLGELLSGVVVVETVFNWPGVGRLYVDALLFRDYPIIRGQVLFWAMVFIAVNLLVDLVYGLINPRIRYE